MSVHERVLSAEIVVSKTAQKCSEICGMHIDSIACTASSQCCFTCISSLFPVLQDMGGLMIPLVTYPDCSQSSSGHDAM